MKLPALLRWPMVVIIVWAAGTVAALVLGALMARSAP